MAQKLLKEIEALKKEAAQIQSLLNKIIPVSDQPPKREETAP